MPKSVFTDSYSALLEALVEARRNSALTQAELAHALGKPQSFISKIERGERRIDLIEFCAVADALGADRYSLFATISGVIGHKPKI